MTAMSMHNCFFMIILYFNRALACICNPLYTTFLKMALQRPKHVAS